MALLVLSLLPILVITLVPGDPTSAALPAGERICPFCGTRAAADGILNVVLFLPLGWILGRRRGIWEAILWGAALSTGLELTQLFLAGRFSSASDVVANTLGAGLGAWVGLRERWPAKTTVTVSLVAMLVPGFLLAPAPPDGVYYGQWTAVFGDMEAYRGRVLEARVGDFPVPSWQSSHSEEMRRDLREGAPVRLRVRAGPPPDGPAPVFSVFDGRQRKIFMIGVAGDDVFVDLWRVGTALRFETPRWWWRHALAGVAVGDSIRITYALGPRGPCLTLQGRTRCLTAAGSGGGWSLLVPGGREGPPYVLGGLVWTMLLGLPLGLVRTPWKGKVLLSLGLVATVAALSWALPYWPTPWIGFPILLLGAGVGMKLQRAER